MAEATVRALDVDRAQLARSGGFSIRLAPDLEIIYDDPSQVPTVFEAGRPASATRSADIAKRLFDISVAATALVVSAPAWFLAFVVAGLIEGGPTLFGQDRIGRGGRMFRCWKFRTMRPDAEHVLAQMLESDPELASQWNESHKLDEDPRVTGLGRLFRRFDLDEIPQFVNVLRGDMSIVGPRPVVPDEAPNFGESFPTVLSVRPGLTGAWQVSGRNSMTYDERVQQEVRYVKTRSFLGDLAICFQTPLALLRRNGGR